MLYTSRFGRKIAVSRMFRWGYDTRELSHAHRETNLKGHFKPNFNVGIKIRDMQGERWPRRKEISGKGRMEISNGERYKGKYCWVKNNPVRNSCQGSTNNFPGGPRYTHDVGRIPVCNSLHIGSIRNGNFKKVYFDRTRCYVWSNLDGHFEEGNFMANSCWKSART